METENGPRKVISLTRSVPAFAFTQSAKELKSTVKPRSPSATQTGVSQELRSIYNLAQSVSSDFDSMQRELSSIDTTDENARQVVSSIESYLSHARSTMQDIVDSSKNF